MMKAVATALVLIVGAAVVLWYGNTLNSWVVGGLIGGLAALLLSIPISLTLFSYISRRQEERIRLEEEEVFVDVREHYEAPPRIVTSSINTGEKRSDYLPSGPVWSGDDPSSLAPRRTGHNLPVPSDHPRLPVASQKRSMTRGNGASRYARNTSQERTRTGTQSSSRKTQYPGFQGYEPGFSQHRSAALRKARQEALHQRNTYFDDVDSFSKYPSKRPSSSVWDDSQDEYPRVRRTSRQLSPHDANIYPRRLPRRVVNSSSPHERDRRALPPAEADRTSRERRLGPETDYLADHRIHTEALHPSTHDSYISDDETSSEVRTENLSGTLQRRAPYMYEGDSLREELARHLQGPVTRRSSLQKTTWNEDEEE